MKAAWPLITIGLAATPIALNQAPPVQDETVEGLRTPLRYQRGGSPRGLGRNRVTSSKQLGARAMGVDRTALAVARWWLPCVVVTGTV